MDKYYPPAPAFDVCEWLNSPDPVTLASLRGRVVMLHAFQMLCPGCVTHGMPQAQRVRQVFGEEDVAVIGLHTVFEHHDVMTPEALRVFVAEYRLRFPIGIDRQRPGERIPATMHALQLQGTPSTVLLDRQGRVRLHHLGQIDDMWLGGMIGRLLAEPAADAASAGTGHAARDAADGCAAGACRAG